MLLIFSYNYDCTKIILKVKEKKGRKREIIKQNKTKIYIMKPAFKMNITNHINGGFIVSVKTKEEIEWYMKALWKFNRIKRLLDEGNS